MDIAMPWTKCFQLGILGQDLTLNIISHSPRSIWSMTMDSAYDTVLVHLQVALKLQTHAALACNLATYCWSGSFGYCKREWLLHQQCDLDFHQSLMAFTFMVKFLNSRVIGMGGPIDIEQKGWRSVIYDDPDLLMTEVKYHLLDSDWGDFRCRCVVDLSNEISAMVCWFSSFW